METRVVGREEWRAAEAAHERRVDAATQTHRTRRREGRAHPVEDFLFTYYRFRPAQLRRWHPGAGVVLEATGGMPRAGWRFYAPVRGARVGDGVALDVAAYLLERGVTVRFVRDLLAATAARPPQLGCFGLHEWAMVYRLTPGEVRHAGWPLRLGAAGTNEVVESHQIRCTHYDAFRFYTPPARSLNLLQPRRETQAALEQPGCLHAGMDCYKWAFKLAPAIPSELVMDCFDLAREIRELDMRAAPYDLRELGYEPVRIETPEGKAEYVRAQRGFAERSQRLRHRLVAECDRLLAELHAESAQPRPSPPQPSPPRPSLPPPSLRHPSLPHTLLSHPDAATATDRC
ncbi:MAG TPA: 3-methyladenine DNA glycosylase [Dermatophilaceae bacterium]|nr:3-methyladenine DNA glycosylase [Dermatophilaceae bacterium]